MLKYPSPIEKELDRVRDKMWQEADQNSERWFVLIREKAKQAEQEIRRIKGREKNRLN